MPAAVDTSAAIVAATAALMVGATLTPGAAQETKHVGIVDQEMTAAQIAEVIRRAGGDAIVTSPGHAAGADDGDFQRRILRRRGQAPRLRFRREQHVLHEHRHVFRRHRLADQSAGDQVMARPAVFITGAAQGIGAAIALAFARAGYDLAISSTDKKKLADSAAAAKAAGARVASSTTKSLPRPCILVNFNFIANYRQWLL